MTSNKLSLALMTPKIASSPAGRVLGDVMFISGRSVAMPNTTHYGVVFLFFFFEYLPPEACQRELAWN